MKPKMMKMWRWKISTSTLMKGNRFYPGPFRRGQIHIPQTDPDGRKAHRGQIYINDQDLTTIKRRKVPYLRRQMGAVFQDFRLIPTMTVYENVAFAMRVTNINNKTIKNRVPFALSPGWPWEDKMDRLPDELFRRRAAARCRGPRLGPMAPS